MENKDVKAFNRNVWNSYADRDNQWTIPVSSEVIEIAKRGRFSVLLTPLKSVPQDWLPDMVKTKILGLASAGGQQMPVFAAAGAEVVSLDISDNQLKQDTLVAEREGLYIETVQGDMEDLSMFENNTFDMIFHPVSNCFVPEINGIWMECFRVLKKGGRLLSGFANPILYMFDDISEIGDPLKAVHSIPYSDIKTLSESRKKEYKEKSWALEFGHTLEDQIGGQLEAGFILKGFYEDKHHLPDHKLNCFISTFIATLAVKP